MAATHIRSSVFVQTIAFVRETFGDDAAEQILDTVPKAVQRKVELAVLDAWVDFDLFQGLLARLVETHYEGNVEGVRESGRFAAAEEFPRRFGALSLPADLGLVERFNAFAPMWRMLVDQGEIRATVNDGQVELHVSGFPAATPLYGQRLCGWLEGYMVRLTGQKAEVELRACDPAAASNFVFRFVG